jgi:hypothetical protein
MIGRSELFVLLNINACHCDRCTWQRVDDICEALEAGNIFASSGKDAITGLFFTEYGAAQSEAVPLLPTTSA